MKSYFTRILCTCLSVVAFVCFGCAANDKDKQKAYPIAGADVKITRDGSPKKYFTLSIDDGIKQDLKIIEILKKYNMNCCTFNINTGLCGVSWEWVGQQFNRPDVTHVRFTEEELKSGIYDGFDVEVHTLNHSSLKNYNYDPEKLKSEINKDAANIAKITGYKPIGMAWPGGDTEYDDVTVRVVLNHTDIRFARASTSTYRYDLPKCFMKWQPTCSISDDIMNIGKRFLEAPCEEDMLFFVWGHGYELDLYDSYEKFESFIKMMSEAEDVVFVTNAEFYHLFKEEIPSWKEV